VPDSRRLPIWTLANADAVLTIQIGALIAENKDDAFAQLNAIGVAAVDWIRPKPPGFDPFGPSTPQGERYWPPRRLDAAPASSDEEEFAEGAFVELLSDAINEYHDRQQERQVGNLFVELESITQIGRTLHVEVKIRRRSGTSRQSFKISVAESTTAVPANVEEAKVTTPGKSLEGREERSDSPSALLP
jgi:hypothetical protein